MKSKKSIFKYTLIGMSTLLCMAIVVSALYIKRINYSVATTDISSNGTSYYVSLSLNGGTWNGKTCTGGENDNCYVLEDLNNPKAITPTPVHATYPTKLIFEGWYLYPDFTVKYDPTTYKQYMAENGIKLANIRVLAKWKKVDSASSSTNTNPTTNTNSSSTSGTSGTSSTSGTSETSSTSGTSIPSANTNTSYYVSLSLNGGTWDGKTCTGGENDNCYVLEDLNSPKAITPTPVHATYPTKLIFEGWYLYPDFKVKYDPATYKQYIADNDITLSNIHVIAKWKKTESTAPNENSYLVYFHYNGGSSTDNPSYITMCASCSKELPSPVYETYPDKLKFDGWYLDTKFQNKYDPNTYETKESKIMVYAKWKQTATTEEVYYVYLHYNGGVKQDEYIRMCDSCSKTLPTPVHATYPSKLKFDGWYLDKNFTESYNASTYKIASGTNRIVVYAKWVSSTTSSTPTTPTTPTSTCYNLFFEMPFYSSSIGYVMYALPEGTSNPIQICTNSGESYVLPKAIMPQLFPQYANYWTASSNNVYTERGSSALNNIYDPNTYELPSVKTYLKVSPIINIAFGAETNTPYYALYLYDKVSNTNYTWYIPIVNTDIKAENYFPTPTRAGYKFEGWYTDKELTKKYTYKTFQPKKIYNYQEGTGLLLSVSYDTTTLYQKWTPIVAQSANQTKTDFSLGTYILSFNSNGGGEYNNLSILIEGSDYEAPILPVPQKEGYNFEGWYSDEALTTEYDYKTFTGEINETYNVYAKWSKIETINKKDSKYTFKFESNGGNSINSIDALVDSAPLSTLPTPVKEGYVFAGWYLDKELTNLYMYVTFVGEKDKTYTLYAKWEKVEINLFYSPETGVYVQADANTLPSVYTLSAMMDSLSDDASKKVNNNLKDTVTYDINVILNSQLYVQPNGTVKVYFPEFIEEENIAIYRVDENNELIPYEVKYEGGTPYIETNHFSTYVVGKMTFKMIIKKNLYIIIAGAVVFIGLILLLSSSAKSSKKPVKRFY